MVAVGAATTCQWGAGPSVTMTAREPAAGVDRPPASLVLAPACRPNGGGVPPASTHPATVTTRMMDRGKPPVCCCKAKMALMEEMDVGGTATRWCTMWMFGCTGC